MKMEKEEEEEWIDENDDEEAQEPSILVPGNIPSSPTPFSLSLYPRHLSSSPFPCFHGMKNQVLEQEDLTPHFVMLEEMDFSS